MPSMLQGKVAVVTGSGGGLGKSHATALAAQGAKVVVNDIGVSLNGTGGSNSPAENVVNEIRKAGGTAIANCDSVATSEGAQNIINSAISNFGRLDILVNNAGFLRDRMIFNMSDEEWDAVIKVHLYGTFYCMRAACKIMKEQNYGRIINTSSASAFGNLGQANYAAAKAAIVGLTRTAAKDMLKYNTTCNAIRPGAMSRMNLSDDLYQARVKSLGEVKAKEWKSGVESMKPEYVANVAVYLASDAAANISGCVFEVRGNVVCIYHEPPRIGGILIKKENGFSSEDLVDIMPKTLTANLGTLGVRPELTLAADAKSWEFADDKLEEIKATKLPFDT